MKNEPTKKELNELKRIAGDKMWRMNHLYKIRNKSGELVTFKLNKAQKEFVENKHTRNIILKSRQLGFTTFESVDMLDDVLWSKNFDALQVAHTDKDAQAIFDSKVSFAWENFDKGLKEILKWQVATDKANKLKFNFGDGSYSSILVTNSGRSGTYQRVHISELAKLVKKYPAKAGEVITGTIPSVPMHGRIDIESTAEGEFGLFHDMFWEAWNKGKPSLPTEFKAHFFNWTYDEEQISKITDTQIKSSRENPDFEEFIKIQKDRKLTDKQITYYYMIWGGMQKNWGRLKQEYPFTPEEAFVASGHKHFDKDALAKMKTFEGIKENDWTIYEDFKTDGTYMIGADVAEGLGQDSSTAVVLKQGEIGTPLKVVAIFKDNYIAPDLFAYELKRFGLRYGGALVCPERNSIGNTTILKLKEIYQNIYREVDKRKELEVRRTGVKIKRYGWLTTAVSKPQMLTSLREAIDNELIEIPSKELIHELRTYDKEDLTVVRFDKGQTKHWDLVMALAIAFQMRSKVVPKIGTQRGTQIGREQEQEIYTYKPLEFK